MMKPSHAFTPWPALDYVTWKETCETLHRWLQMVGKVRLYRSPWLNHSWHATYYVTARGLTTSAIPLHTGNLTADFDFIDHKLILQASTGHRVELGLRNESVADFYQRFEHALHTFGVACDFDDHPNECADYLRFSEDRTHKTYDPNHAHQFFQALVLANNALQRFRAKFTGKCSPVHFFWGSMDLAVTRFSGRAAPEHPGVAPHISKDVMREAYSHEVSSVGFWPGNDLYPHAAFYSYAYPAPDGFEQAIIEPMEAFFHKELGEFLLPYEAVRNALEPEAMLAEFFESTFETAAKGAEWNLAETGQGPYLQRLAKKYGQPLGLGS